jgi:hypothetical protein
MRRQKKEKGCWAQEFEDGIAAFAWGKLKKKYDPHISALIIDNRKDAWRIYTGKELRSGDMDKQPRRSTHQVES